MVHACKGTYGVCSSLQWLVPFLFLKHQIASRGIQATNTREEERSDRGSRTGRGRRPEREDGETPRRRRAPAAASMRVGILSEEMYRCCGSAEADQTRRSTTTRKLPNLGRRVGSGHDALITLFLLVHVFSLSLFFQGSGRGGAHVRRTQQREGGTHEEKTRPMAAASTCR